MSMPSEYERMTNMLAWGAALSKRYIVALTMRRRCIFMGIYICCESAAISKNDGKLLVVLRFVDSANAFFGVGKGFYYPACFRVCKP